MKLKNIFAAATVCLGLSFGAVFSSNAALITQEFTFDGGSIEVGVLSENGIDDGSDVFVWDIDSYEFINLRFTDDLVLIDNGFDLVAIEAGEYFSQDGSLVLTAVGDIFASVPPDANGNPDFFSTDGFFEFGFQAELFDLGIGDFDLFDFNIYESTGLSGFELVLEGPINSVRFLELERGQVSVNAPTVFSIISLGVFTLLLRRKA